MITETFGAEEFTDEYIEPDRILEAAKGNLRDLLIIAFDKDGKEYIAGSSGDLGEVLLMLEYAKKCVMRMYIDNNNLAD